MSNHLRHHAPVDFAVIEFPSGALESSIAPALLTLIAEGTVHVLDLALVSKDDDGSVSVVEFADLDDDAGLGGLAALLAAVIDEDDLVRAGELLKPGTTGLLVIWENTWALPFVDAIITSGGNVIASERLPITDVLDALDALA